MKITSVNNSIPAGTHNRLYTAGGPVQVGGGLYIERHADRAILDYCRAGEYAFVLSTRQVGKSSLMFRTAQQLKVEGASPVIIDLTRTGTEATAEQWYLGLLDHLSEKLLPGFDVLQWWQEKAHFGETERFVRFFREVLLARVAERIVIFIDEIDTTLSLKFSDDFFAAIRAMYHARAEEAEFRRLSFVLIGVANPNDLIADPKRTPFNIGKSVELTDFSLEEALPLAGGFGLTAHEARQTLQWALDWTGGHPFLTQRLCRGIAEAGRAQWSESGIAELVNDVFFKQAEQDSNIRAVRDLLTKRAPDVKAVLTTYRKVLRGKRIIDEERSPITSHLKLSGVVRRDGSGALDPRNRVYRLAFDERWVKAHSPVDWRKRFLYALIVMLTALPLITVPLSIYAWNRKGEAQQAAGKEKKAADAEREARLLAEQRQLEAESERKNALTAAERERKAKRLAEQRQLEAESERKNALTAAERERKAKRLAEQRQLEAESERKNALTAAEREREAKYLAEQRQETTEQERKRAQQLAIAEQNAKLEAERQGKIARSRELAAYAKSYIVGDPDLSFQLAARAIKIAETDQALGAFREVLPQTFLHAQLQVHTDRVASAAFSPDGKWVVTASVHKTARVWEAPTGPSLATLQGHTASVNSAAFSPDGKWVVTASGDNTARVWEAATGRSLATLQGHTASVNSAAFSPDGKWVVTASLDYTARVWDEETGTSADEVMGHIGRAASAAYR